MDRAAEPLFLLYRDLPGNDVPPENFGTLGQSEISTLGSPSKADFHSTVVDILLSITSVILGVAVWRLAKRTE
jgi:hypothetical protein